ncbi:type II and III secretion system protein family protein [Arvimicrobium flavum]|uniref:type II and III secretion system protein family protein n=1 Tax=Arvimicrobium flavum TaxID=3393320 RepID=UPI00237AC41C|nr:type II and III secretion system protein family protein [Mesorhizobium shangrilense]
MGGFCRTLTAPTVRNRLVALVAAVMLVAGGLAPASAADGVIRISSTKPASVKIARGKPRTIKTDVPFYEIVIGDPEIANVNPLTDRSFYVLGNNLGTTGIALFDQNKQLVGTVDVEVTLDTERLASTIRDTVPGADIKVKSANGRLVLSGEAQDAVAAEKAQKIASEFSGEENVINSVNISSSQQVQLNVRFVEVNRDVARELGTKITAAYAGHNGGVIINSDPKGPVSPTPAGQIIGGLISGGWSIDVAIKALEDRGVARRLAEPNLIARSGEKASFLAGGEFPIPVSEEDNRVTVTYKKFGISLDFMPTVLSDGLISLDIEPEVSSVDPSSSYQVGNISIPGFIVRRASTSVDLKSGQSFMVAGLLQSENHLGNQRVPGLGQMPVLGALFSSKAYERRETELVMIVTPYLVKPIDPSRRAVTPADQLAPANDADFFLGNVEEVKVSEANRAVAAANRRAAAPTSGHFLELAEQ